MRGARLAQPTTKRTEGGRSRPTCLAGRAQSQRKRRRGEPVTTDEERGNRICACRGRQRGTLSAAVATTLRRCSSPSRGAVAVAAAAAAAVSPPTDLAPSATPSDSLSNQHLPSCAHGGAAPEATPSTAAIGRKGRRPHTPFFPLVRLGFRTPPLRRHWRARTRPLKHQQFSCWGISSVVLAGAHASHCGAGRWALRGCVYTSEDEACAAVQLRVSAL